MSQRLNAYFVREAGEYLEQIQEALSADEVDGERLVRLARGVRGSAQMAGAGGVAPVTERMEVVLRGVLAGTERWSDASRDLLLRTVAELKGLLGSLDHWGDAQREQVGELLDRWDSHQREQRSEERGAPSGTVDPDGPAPAAGDPDTAAAGVFADAEEEELAGSRSGADGEPAQAGSEPQREEEEPQRERESRREDDGVIPISALFYDDAGPHVIASGQDDVRPAGDGVGETDEIVPIEALLLRGSAAARAAIALRPRLDQMIASGATAGDLAAVHDEIFDLLQLSISEATA
jgi:chemotaxis protein histidine kinase CheA